MEPVLAKFRHRLEPELEESLMRTQKRGIDRRPVRTSRADGIECGDRAADEFGTMPLLPLLGNHEQTVENRGRPWHRHDAPDGRLGGIGEEDVLVAKKSRRIGTREYGYPLCGGKIEYLGQMPNLKLGRSLDDAPVVCSRRIGRCGLHLTCVLSAADADGPHVAGVAVP